jgi:hypothetical protein
MAKTTSIVDTPETEDTLVDGVATKFYGPDKGSAVLAAWQGLYHLFGARATFRVTPDGVFVDNLTCDPKYDMDQIVEDISKHNRRLELVPLIFWVQGQAPDDFADVAAITALMVQYWRGSVEDNSSKTPGYLKDAVADYKATRNLLKKRGPKRKVFRLDSLDDIDESTLKGISPEALSRLRETINAAMAAKS